MATSGFKTTAPPLKAVRKQAGRHLDAAIKALSAGTAEPNRKTARRELTRYQALLDLVRRPLGRETYKRENQVINKARKQLRSLHADAEALLDRLVNKSQLDPADQALSDAREALRKEMKSADQKEKPAGVPDPVLLRLVADLAEARMRCRYWHLPDDGFEIFASGLRTSYGRASRSLANLDDPAKAASEAQLLADQLRLLERAWPELLVVHRKAIQTIAQDAHGVATCEAMRLRVEALPPLLDSLDAERKVLSDRIASAMGRVFAESASAFTRRVAAYWEASARPATDT